MADSEKIIQDSSSDVPLDKPALQKAKVDGPNQPNSPMTQPRYRERQLGVWTLYYPITGSWLGSAPIVVFFRKACDLTASVPTVWKFVWETLSLGPLLFAVYFVAEVASSIAPAIHLQNNSKIMSLAERVLTDHERRDQARKEFSQVFIIYFATVIFGWASGRVNAYTEPIIEQRVSLHFKRRILKVRSRLDLSMSEDPAVKSRLEKVTGYRSQAWSVLSGLAELTSVSIQFIGQISVLARMIRSQDDALVFGLACIVRPLLSQMSLMDMSTSFYAVITNQHWLHMNALHSLGTSNKFKKEVLSGELDKFINSQYEKDMKNLGDTCGEYPPFQLRRMIPFRFEDISAVFDALPFLLFALGNIQDRSDRLSLTSLIMIQQSANTFQKLILRVIYSGGRMWDLFDNVVGLYEVLDMKPLMKDGNVMYPDDKHLEYKGAAIEFRRVDFTYPGTDKLVLKDLSFTINSGQLCVIVGENGCGKSTTINLITRLYDGTGGSVFIDGHPISDYKISSLRSATNVMYQDYQHLPLTIQENILLGSPDSKDPSKDVEDASKLGGSYDFVQRLPLKFDTNLEPESSGYSNRRVQENTSEKYKMFIDAQKPTKLSGGEWQRLALSRTFMKNSDRIRLLCYDEPSASLDPKAEYEIFERLRNLRGEKTMIFVTHRFGHLTKHADLILYVKDGSIVEQGTHKQLLVQGGEYAKMYEIQSRAFLDAS